MKTPEELALENKCLRAELEATERLYALLSEKFNALKAEIEAREGLPPTGWKLQQPPS